MFKVDLRWLQPTRRLDALVLSPYLQHLRLEIYLECGDIAKVCLDGFVYADAVIGQADLTSRLRLKV